MVFAFSEEEHVTMWGRDFNLPVILDMFHGEEATVGQKTAYVTFMSKFDDVVKQALERIMLVLHSEHGIDVSSTSFNVFSYVIPKAIYVSRQEGTVGLLFKFRFSEENELAIRFVDGVVVDIGTQDIIL